MRFFALATDYDGTLARNGEVAGSTVAALRRLRASGRKAILVTGRELPELFAVFPHLELFDLIVAENGALLYFPKDRREQALAEAPPEQFLTALRERAVSPLSIGRAIVASSESESTKVFDAIRSLGLELQVIFNKGSLMVLPSGVNKATGLSVALNHLGLSPHNAVGVGDAENDHALLRFCECGVAVGNALPALKKRADLVMHGSDGEGVVELIDRLISDDLADAADGLSRHDLLLGRLPNGAELRIPVHGKNLLVADSAGPGNSAVVTGFVKRLMDRCYQVCVVDTEGRYGSLGDAMGTGSARKGFTVDETMTVLEKPEHSVVVTLAGIRLEGRPNLFQVLAARLHRLRARTGRPHWLVVQEAAHILPAGGGAPPFILPEAVFNTMLVTAQPERVHPSAIAATDVLIASGKEPERALHTWSQAAGAPVSGFCPNHLGPDQALMWQRQEYGEPSEFRIVPYGTADSR